MVSSPFYEEHWKNAKAWIDAVRPASALEEVALIEQKAIEENNLLQRIKARVVALRLTVQDAPDQWPAQIKGMESLMATTEDVAGKALLQSITAELYLSYFRDQAYAIRKRTDVVGTPSDDLSQWTKNTFADTICNLLSASQQPIERLLATPVDEIGDLLSEGNTDDLEPTLFDLLSRRRVELLSVLRTLLSSTAFHADVVPLLVPAEAFVSQETEIAGLSIVERDMLQALKAWLQVRLNVGKAGALIHADLFRLTTLKALADAPSFRIMTATSYRDVDAAYLTALQALSTRYERDAAVLAVMEAEASIYLQYHQADDSTFRLYRHKAYTVCARGLSLYPTAAYSSNLRNLQAEITRPTLDIKHQSVARRQQPMVVDLTATNIDQLELTVYRFDLSPMAFFELTNKVSPTDLDKGTCLERRIVSLQKDTLFNPTQTVLELNGRPYGQYAFRLQTVNDCAVSVIGYFVVSDLTCLIQRNEQHHLYVVDRGTGIPQAGVKVRSHTFTTKWNHVDVQALTAQQTTNAQGYTTLTLKDHNNVLFFEKGEDRYLQVVYPDYDYYPSEAMPSDQQNLSLLTDRALYRPGQTVHFKGIAYRLSRDDQRVLPNETHDVDLLDANDRVIAKQTFKTNAFGSFSGAFVLPDDGFNGTFHLRSGDVYASIQVEAYKRPSFEVTLEQPESEVRFGSAVHVKGLAKAYAGHAVTGAEVTYRVVRRAHTRWWWIDSPEAVIAVGEARTDADGRFTVTFTPERQKNQAGEQCYTYSVEVSVTDQKGETREGERRLSVGDKTLFIETDLSMGKILLKTDKTPIHVYVETLNGVKRPAEVDYELILLDKAEDAPSTARQTPRARWQAVGKSPERKPGKRMHAGRHNTGKNPLMLDFTRFPSGAYQLLCSTTDDRGETVTAINEFILYAADDKQPPIPSTLWLQASQDWFEPGRPAVVHLGTSAKNVHALYQVIRGGTLLESRWMTMSNTLTTLILPYQTAYGDGVFLVVTVVKDEQLYTERIALTLKQPDKTLTPKLTVFRDKLKPGERTEWSLCIPEVIGLQTTAEVLATLYDASLDAMVPHTIHFAPRYVPDLPFSMGWKQTDFQPRYAFWRSDVVYEKPYTIMYKDIDWRLGASSNWQTFAGIQVTSVQEALSGRVTGLSVKAAEAAGNEVADLQGHAVDIMEKDVSDADVRGTEATKATINVTPRRQFNETAFFYPHLRTDKDGNVVFAFTMPESLTRWNLKVLAHTTDLFTGSLNAEVETQQELMVQLNLPRFVRQSDRPLFSATVVNLSDTALTIDVTLSLHNPADETPLAVGVVAQPTQTICLAPGETRAVTWSLEALGARDLVVCKVVGSTALFSDGEQHYLPVLPDKELITETLPLTVKVNQTKDYLLDALLKPSKGITPHALTVELSPNPSWVALLALPSMAEPSEDNAFECFTAYYVSRLCTYIANSYPKLSAAFEQWRRVGNSREALLSTLSKHQELKTVLLEESPWVLAANDETEQRRQLALLFDLNLQAQQQQWYWNKLTALQQPSGGFSWFEGMPESRYITQYLLLNLARLERMIQQDSATVTINPLILKVLAYVDKEITDDFKALQQQGHVDMDACHIGNIHWQYLHLRAYFPQVPLPEATQSAVSFYTKQAGQYWPKATLYGQAATALLLARSGDTVQARAILTSLKERSRSSEELGMYWAQNKPGSFWYERPIGVQTMLLEAFSEVAPDNVDNLDAMKTWLLRQKQTQRWDTKLSTVDAIYALLKQGSDWFSSDNTVSLTLGTKAVPTDGIEAVTGYVKHTYPAEALQPDMGKVSVSFKGDAGMAWGGIYWQYFQDIDQVSAAGEGLSVNKHVFVEQTTTSGKAMVALSNAKALKVGDKVITRLFVTVDRDMDFVVLKDQRAACLEPANQRSGYVWHEGVGYYETSNDVSTRFFFEHLPKGRYAFEYVAFVNNAGTFTDGVATVQCLYAPEFSAHSSGGRLVVHQQ